MKSLNSFLNPQRKPNLKFVLSDAFKDENGKPIEWEMKALSAEEGIAISKALNSNDYTEVMCAYVANALVYPNLRDKDLLDGLSEKAGRPILKAEDALKLMVNDAELAELISQYNQHSELTTNFADKVNEVKN